MNVVFAGCTLKGFNRPMASIARNGSIRRIVMTTNEDTIPMSDDLDRDRVEGMAKVMLEAIRENHLRGPLGRDRVFEALNALAFCVGVSIAGAGAAGGAKEAKQFFDLALRQAIIEAGKLEQPRPRYTL